MVVCGCAALLSSSAEEHASQVMLIGFRLGVGLFGHSLSPGGRGEEGDKTSLEGSWGSGKVGERKIGRLRRLCGSACFSDSYEKPSQGFPRVPRVPRLRGLSRLPRRATLPRPRIRY